MAIQDPGSPSTSAERITAIDALRGFALLGVFVANMISSFSGWIDLPEAERWAMFGMVGDRVTGLLTLVFIDGKFYSLFSMLFGAGFAIQLARLERRGVAGARIFRRRTTVLLGIGLIHLVFIWLGDILTLYALCGFVLLMIRNWSDRRLLGVALALIAVVAPAKMLLRAIGVPLDLGVFGLIADLARLQGVREATPDIYLEILRMKDWGSFFTYQFQGVVWRVGYLLESGRIPKVLALMMIGMWAGRRLVAGTLLDDRRLLKRVLAWGLCVGLPGNLLYAVSFALGLGGGSPVISFLQDLGYALGVIPLGMAYGAAFLLLWPRARRVLGLFAPAGRMALTNYLTQSLLGLFIFMGVGLGWAGYMTPPQFVGLAVLLFAVQGIASALWLRRFGQGPMEALWRRLTYGGRRG